MRVSDIFRSQPLSVDQVATLRTACSEFLDQSGGLPLFKVKEALSVFTKTKVRFHDKTNVFIETFNQAFFEEHGVRNLHQRSIFASSTPPTPIDQLVYVFPKNGFKFLYNSQVPDANSRYKFVFEQLLEEFDQAYAENTVKDLLRYTYEDHDLNDGINKGAEVILYDVPFYYAVKADHFPDYKQLLDFL